MKAVSFFAGVGGIDKGFEKAGFKIIWANELEIYPAETFRANFDCELVVEDIKNIRVEDIPDFDKNRILANEDGEEVLNLVLEVSRKEGESKEAFLQRIIDSGSQNAKILKCADRISNMISLGFVTDPKFIERYCDETEYYILPMALEIDYNMYQELINLIITRRRYLEDGGYFDSRTKVSS